MSEAKEIDDQSEEDLTSFGAAAVRASEKQGLVNRVFARVAPYYDLMNDLMSGGLHRLWKDELVAWLAPPKGPQSFRLIDVAGGTGDVAERVLAEGGSGTRAIICDISGAMIEIGRERLGARENLDFVQANAEALPFADRSLDAYCVAFGMRNMTRLEAALREAFRVLRPGGRFLCLEFSAVEMPLLDRLYDAYSFTAIPALGAVVAGDREAYEYLVESIRRFPNQKRFAGLIENAGFERVTYRNLTGGIAALHSAWRL